MRVTSIRLDDTKLNRLDALSKTLGLSRGQVVNAALDNYLEYQEWFLAAVGQGLRDLEAGRIASAEEVDRVFCSFGVDVA